MQQTKVWFSKTIVFNMRYYGKEYIDWAFDCLERYYNEQWDDFFYPNDYTLAKYVNERYNPIYIWKGENELQLMTKAELPEDISWTVTQIHNASMFPWKGV